MYKAEGKIKAKSKDSRQKEVLKKYKQYGYYDTHSIHNQLTMHMYIHTYIQPHIHRYKIEPYSAGSIVYIHSYLHSDEIMLPY